MNSKTLKTNEKTPPNIIENFVSNKSIDCDSDQSSLDTWKEFYNKDGSCYYEPAQLLLEKGYIKMSGPCIIENYFFNTHVLFQMPTALYISYQVALGVDVKEIKEYVISAVEEIYQSMTTNDKWLPEDIFNSQRY